MGNWKLARWQEPRALTTEVLREPRTGQPAGLSRRQIIRRSLGAIVGLWTLEITGGTIAFLWPNLSGGFGSTLTLGTSTPSAVPAVTGSGHEDRAPSYFQAARTYVTLLDPPRLPARYSPQGDGAVTNVRTLYQRCTHLGCKPNFCTKNYWFECPCHGSRYDRLGIKVQELGPAPRGLDRFASSVDAKGVLTVDTSKITLGPLPVPLGQPGLIPPKSPTGCI